MIQNQGDSVKNPSKISYFLPLRKLEEGPAKCLSVVYNYKNVGPNLWYTVVLARICSAFRERGL